MRPFVLAPLLIVLAAIPLLAPMRAGAVESRLVHEGDADYRVVTIDLRADALDLYWRDANGAAYGSIEALRRSGESAGRVLAFAANAGIYDRSDRPLGLTIAALLHLQAIRIREAAPERADDGSRSQFDVRGAVEAIRGVPGLGMLVGLAAFNNVLGGVFMALMDAYGLELVSVETWGLLWGFIMISFIVGGIAVASVAAAGGAAIVLASRSRHRRIAS